MNCSRRPQFVPAGMDRFADKADWGSRDSDHGGCPDGLMREGSAVVSVLGIVAGRVVAHCFFFLKKNSGRMDWLCCQYQL